VKTLYYIRLSPLKKFSVLILFLVDLLCLNKVLGLSQARSREFCKVVRRLVKLRV